MSGSDQLPELLQLFSDKLSTNSSGIMYRFVDGSGHSQVQTYEDLYLKSSSVAQKLLESRQEEQKRALLIYSPGFDFIIALFGCFLSNTTAIPIAIPKPRTSELFAHFLNHARPHIILTSGDLEGRIRKLMPDQGSCDLLATDNLVQAKEGLGPIYRKDSVALIQYTSGTTTQPKGVLITFDNLVHNLRAIQKHFHLHEKSVCFSWLPHYHDMGLIDGLLTPIFNDCTAILCSPVHVISNPVRWMEIITQYRVTHTGGPNFFFDLCAERIPDDSGIQIDLKSLSHVYVSAEPVRRVTIEKFTDAFRRYGFSGDLFTPGYGLAEATLMVSCKAIQSPQHYFTREGQTYVGLGRPIPGIDLKIIDPGNSQEVRENEAGEICLHGPTVSQGYYQDPDQTEKSFVSNTEQGVQKKYFKTGDLGVLQEGELFVIGRLKDTLIIRGLKYQPEDLEYVITHCHPYLLPNCAVFTMDEEQSEKLIVLQEIRKSETISSPDIVKAIKNSVYESFGLTVFDVILLSQGQILKTTSGKIKRMDNRNKYLQGEFSGSA